MRWISTGRQIGRTLKSAARLRTIVGVLVKNGFQPVVEKVRLGRFLIRKYSAEIDTEHYTVAERLRMSFEELGPTWVKFGQLLASRPDLIPPDFIREFKKLHDQVPGISFQKSNGCSSATSNATKRNIQIHQPRTRWRPPVSRKSIKRFCSMAQKSSSKFSGPELPKSSKKMSASCSCSRG